MTLEMCQVVSDECTMMGNQKTKQSIVQKGLLNIFAIYLLVAHPNAYGAFKCQILFAKLHTKHSFKFAEKEKKNFIEYCSCLAIFLYDRLKSDPPVDRHCIPR